MINIDKFVHFIAGMIIGLMGCYLLTPRHAILAVMVAAMVKEIYDSRNPDTHTVDGLDFVATVVGGLAGIELI